MACACIQRRKKSLTYVRSMAVRMSQIREEDMQIYSTIFHPYGQIYEFEPLNPDRKDIVEYVKYRK